MFVNFGRDRKEPLFVLLCLFAAAFSAFASFQHQNITGFVPAIDAAAQMPFWMTAFFLTMIGWAGALGLFFTQVVIRIAAGFIVAHILFVGLAYLPPFVIKSYFLIFGLLGFGFGFAALVQRFSLGLVLVSLIGAVAVPFLWLTVGWILFALPHSNYFTAFAGESIPGYGIADVLHQRAYIRFIHDFGIPSVGINGLGYHHYHWLVGYPLSTLATASDAHISSIHANILPGFTGPVLVHGVLTGLLIGTHRALHFGFAIVGLVALYVLAVVSFKAITYGLVFLSPSSAYSVGLIGPLAGLFVYFYSGNLKRLKAWHFAIFACFLVMVGLAKVTSEFMAAFILGGLWLPYVLIGRTSWLSRGVASFFVSIAAFASIYLVWEALQHNRTDVPVPAAYTLMVSELSSEARQAIEEDVQASLVFQPVGNMEITDYEKSSFWQSAPGFVAIFVTIFMPFLMVLPPSFRRHRVYLLMLVAIGVSALFIFQRTFFGLPRPTPVIYILTPALVLGVISVGQAAGALLMPITRMPKLRFGKTIGTGIAAVSFLFLLALSVGTLRHISDLVALAASSTAIRTVGVLGNQNGQQLVAQLASQRAQSWGIGAQRNWPIQASNYWNVWENLPMKQVTQRLKLVKKQNPRTAIFVPASHEYWQAFQRGSFRNGFFWLQAQTGMPLYRGKISGNQGVYHSLSGRGISDFAFDSGALISMTSNVYCWSRFDGFRIVDIQGYEIIQC